LAFGIDLPVIGIAHVKLVAKLVNAFQNPGLEYRQVGIKLGVAKLACAVELEGFNPCGIALFFGFGLRFVVEVGVPLFEIMARRNREAGIGAGGLQRE